MKKFCYFAAIAVCLGLAGVAHATQINFNANILDPPGGTPETTNSFPVTFDPCSAFTDVSNNYDGPPGLASTAVCFEGENETGIVTPLAVWTSLTITIDDTDSLFGTATCGAVGGPSIFTSSSCTESGNIYTLIFSGGAMIHQGQSFFFVIDAPGVTQSDLLADVKTTTDSAVAGTVPEPNSALLLATGGSLFGLALYADRRRLLGQSLRS